MYIATQNYITNTEINCTLRINNDNIIINKIPNYKCYEQKKQKKKQPLIIKRNTLNTSRISEYPAFNIMFDMFIFGNFNSIK